MRILQLRHFSCEECVPRRELDEIERSKSVIQTDVTTGSTDLRYEPFMRAGSTRNLLGEQLSDHVDAVMGEIAALLDERRAEEVVRAREVLAFTYRRAVERRRANPQGPKQDAEVIRYHGR